MFMCSGVKDDLRLQSVIMVDTSTFADSGHGPVSMGAVAR